MVASVGETKQARKSARLYNPPALSSSTRTAVAPGCRDESAIRRQARPREKSGREY